MLTKIFFHWFSTNLSASRLSPPETASLFFSLTKVFSLKQNPFLKRVVYVLICELATASKDTIIAVSSLIQEFQIASSPDWYRAAALRSLAAVIPPSLLQSVERQLRLAVTDQSPVVASTALVAAFQMCRESREVVRRWMNEIQQQISNEGLPQYHALGILFLLKQNDRMSLVKLLCGIVTKGSSTAGTLILVLRYYQYLLQGGGSSSELHRDLAVINLSSFLRYKNDLESVACEASNVIFVLGCCSDATTATLIGKDTVASAIQTMSRLLASPRIVTRFFAIRLLSQFAHHVPDVVARLANTEIESLVSDSVPGVASLAVATLLKTGDEKTIDNLVSQMDRYFGGEVSDDFKEVVVAAVESLSIKFPQKQPALLDFLLGLLRQEGGYQFKDAVVGCITGIVSRDSSLRDHALISLAEFIEDCEHPTVTIRVLHLIGDHSSLVVLSNSSRFIRVIYNRLLLETPLVRIAALSALFRIAMACDTLRQEALSLLEHSCDDFDDQVRETAAVYAHVVRTSDLKLFSCFVSNESFPVDALEQQLVAYCSTEQSEDFSFDENTFQPLVPEPNSPYASSAIVSTDPILLLPEVLLCGKRLGRSALPYSLTEKETEYSVSLIKHVFEKAIVFEFIIKNTLEDSALLDVSLELHSLSQEQGEMQMMFSTSIRSLPPGSEGTMYLGYSYDQAKLPIGSRFASLLVFYPTECTDSSSFDAFDFSNTLREEYQVEDVCMSFGDFTTAVATICDHTSFEEKWDSLKGTVQSETVCIAAGANIQASISSILRLIGYFPVAGSEFVEKSGCKEHLLLAAMTDMFNEKDVALLRGEFYVERSSVYADISVRANNNSFSKAILHVLVSSE